MLEEQKKQREGVKPNFVIQKKGGQAAASSIAPAVFDKVKRKIQLYTEK